MDTVRYLYEMSHNCQDKDTKEQHCTTEGDRNRRGLPLPVTPTDTASVKFFGTKKLYTKQLCTIINKIIYSFNTL